METRVHRLRPILPLLLATVTVPVAAQSGPAADKQDIVVEGERGRKIAMSDWRLAETEHVLVYSKGDEKRLVRIAHNLEKLHFLLSMLLDRVGQPDETLKLRVTLIGDAADFDHLNLRNLRWQQGPFPRAFPNSLHYDPREDGAVLANADIDQRIVLQPGVLGLQASSLIPATAPQGMSQGLADAESAMALDGVAANEAVIPSTAEGRIYAGFAQHYLLTYFPAAYPRWYLDGFGEMFATMTAEQEGVIEYGRAPEGFRPVMEVFRRYPLEKVLNGHYLEGKDVRPQWTPYHAWALTHLLFFDEQWRVPLRRYLAAVAGGASAEKAAAAFGDVEALKKQLATYHGSKVPFERMTYPVERAPTPFARRLMQSEASLVQGRLELGARLELPPEPAPGTDPKTAQRMTKARQEAIESRDSWLASLRRRAQANPRQLDLQLLLAEAECRSGNSSACLAAADAALAIKADDPAALTWKGTAMVAQAAAGPAAERTARLRAARALIVRGNRADTEATLPLIGYYRSFAAAGERATPAAVDGLAKASESVPAAPATRLLLGQELARSGNAADARRILRPIADGPYDSPEKPRAKAVLNSLR
jgi:hypothetical protein